MVSLQFLRVFIVGQLTKVSKNAVKHAEVWAIHTMLKLVYLETISISTRLGRVITQFSFNKQLSILLILEKTSTRVRRLQPRV